MNRLVKDPLLVAIGTAVILCSEFFSATAQEVKIIRGASSAASIPQLGKLEAAHPKPLSSAQKLQAVQSVVSRRGKKAGSLMSPLVLGPGKLKAGSTSLLLLEPAYVQAHTVARAVFFKPNGRVIVWFTPPSAGLYLIDFTVSGIGPFTLAGREDVQSADPTGEGPNGHLLFVTTIADANKVVDLALGANNGWMFYSCEISQIK